MTIPPQKLLSTLPPDRCYDLRAVDGQRLGTIEYTEALRRAIHGEIEGVCAGSGRIRFVRELSAETRSAIQAMASEDIYERSRPQPLNAITNLGSYRQHLEFGSVWALSMCKSIDGARA